MQANGSWAPLEIIDMTTSGAVRAHEALSTAFFDDMDLAVLDEPVLSVSSGGGLLLDQEASNKTGWSGFVEVELTEIPALPFEGLPSIPIRWRRLTKKRSCAGSTRCAINSTLTRGFVLTRLRALVWWGQLRKLKLRGSSRGGRRLDLI